MRCIGCGSEAATEPPERTSQGYRRFRCRSCGKQLNERSGTLLNWTQYPSDLVALVVLRHLRYKLSLRDLPGMFVLRGIVFSHQMVHEWEAEITPAPVSPRTGSRPMAAIATLGQSAPSWVGAYVTGPAAL